MNIDQQFKTILDALAQTFPAFTWEVKREVVDDRIDLTWAYAHHQDHDVTMSAMVPTNLIDRLETPMIVDRLGDSVQRQWTSFLLLGDNCKGDSHDLRGQRNRSDP